MDGPAPEIGGSFILFGIVNVEIARDFFGNGSGVECVVFDFKLIP